MNKIKSSQNENEKKTFSFLVSRTLIQFWEVNSKRLQKTTAEEEKIMFFLERYFRVIFFFYVMLSTH